MSREHDKLPTSRLLRGAGPAEGRPRRLGLPEGGETSASVPPGADFGAVPLQDGGAPAAAGCGETIGWTPVSPVPIDIRADSAVEFANGIDQALGGNPHTDVSIALNPTVDKGRMTSVGLTVTSSIIRPRWAGGRASDTEKALIRRVEAFIKDHEERHRDLSRSVMQQAVCDALNQPEAKARAILKKAICDLEPKAQEALDAKEGQLQWVKNSAGEVVDFTAVGATHDYHVKGCDPWKPAPPDAGADQAEKGAEK